MIDLEQPVKIKWDKKTKSYFENKGYIFTQYSEYFTVKVKDLMKNSSVRVKVSCDICGETIYTPYRNYNKIVEKNGLYKCRKCNASNVSTIRINNNKERQIRKFQNLISSIGGISLANTDDYNGYNSQMPFLCSKHGLQRLSINQLQQGTVCPECGKEIKRKTFRLSTDELIKRVESKNNNKILNPEEYINSNTNNLKIICGSCGGLFITSLASIEESGGRCSKCGVIINTTKRKLNKESVIKQSTINGICYILNPEEYVNKVTKNLRFKCVECGEEFIKDLSHYTQGEIRCKKCTSKMSKGEYRILQFLEKQNIKYELQKRYKDCKDKKQLPFDFYLPDYNYCIEFDGYQHYHKAKYDTDLSFELRKRHDKIKTEYCKSNGIKLIRIPYYEYNKIDEKLKCELM